jgi:hypothetical protein
VAKLPRPPLRDEDFEAPTLEREVPAELRDPGTAHVTTKLRKAEIDALLVKEREKSGTRRAVSADDIERFERRELRDTIPAPPEPPPLPDEVADLDAGSKR